LPSENIPQPHPGREILLTADRLKRRKRLILFRHAKSDWPEGVDDHDRPLSDRGKKAAPVMGVYLEKNKLIPDLVLVSTARRAQETWARACKAIKTAPPAKNMREIYEAGTARLLDVIRSTGPEVRTLMIVGHNPGIEDLAKRLMKDAGGEAGQRLREKFPTAAMAVLSFDLADWKDIAPETGSLDRFVTPKSIS
jgi:phosphohistidine phosphatase